MKKNFLLTLLLIGSGFLTAFKSHATIPVQSGQKIGFLGDSITEQGAAASGYVNLVIMGLKVEGVDAVAIPAGVSGNTSGNMRSRLGPHVLDKNADWLTLSCGVNDVGMKAKGRGVELEDFKKNVTDIVERALAKNVRIVIMTTTPLGEDLDGERNQQVAPYNDFLRQYAREKNLILADVNNAFIAELKTPLPTGAEAGKRLLADGTHPNQDGQTLMARTVLLALGVPAEDFPKVEKEWQENPRGKGVKVGQGLNALISRQQFDALEKMGKGQAARNIVGELWKKALEESGEPVDSEKARGIAQEKIGAMVDTYIQSH